MMHLHILLSPSLAQTLLVYKLILDHFINLRTLSCSGPQYHWVFLESSSRSGFVFSARLGENLLSWFIIPRNLRISVTLVGFGMLRIALIFSSSGEIPSLSTLWPKNGLHYYEIYTYQCSEQCLLCSVFPVLWWGIHDALHLFSHKLERPLSVQRHHHIPSESPRSFSERTLGLKIFQRQSIEHVSPIWGNESGQFRWLRC